MRSGRRKEADLSASDAVRLIASAATTFDSRCRSVDIPENVANMSAMFRVTIIAVFAAGILAAGCDNSRSNNEPAKPSVQHTNLQTFEVKGVVLEVKPSEKSVVIRHEDIPDFMPGMTMPFDVKDTNLLNGIEAGDPVRFRLRVSDTEGWIDRIAVTGPKTNVLPANAPFHRAREVEPLHEGDLLPAYQFTNQFGNAFSTEDFKGGALAIEFLFTRCPLPNFCPLMASKFAETQQTLLGTAHAPTNWHLLTITFDTEFDTPSVLRRYAEAHDYNSNYWTFATGAPIDISAICEQFNLRISKEEDGTFGHNLRAAVIDPSGRVRKIFIGNEWKPAELTEELIKAATAIK